VVVVASVQVVVASVQVVVASVQVVVASVQVVVAAAEASGQESDQVSARESVSRSAWGSVQSAEAQAVSWGLVSWGLVHRSEPDRSGAAEARTRIHRCLNFRRRRPHACHRHVVSRRVPPP
jgi:hypothetical protein